MSYPGQTLLIGLIAFYRRWLSGRGPLRRVACTFGRTESCSAYGLRMAREVAGTLPEALRLIRARVRRCRRAALYRLPDGWAWGECYDADDCRDLERELTEARELPATTAAVLWSAALLARHCGDAGRLRACAELARGYGGPGHYVVIRDGRGLRGWLRRRLGVGLGLAGTLLAGACVLPSVLALAALAGALAAGLGCWGRHRRQRERFEEQAVANAFTAPSMGGR
ncbi:MAG: membrane protein insertion efficiency factor YidD [Gemmataceae bacterium]|nr:membrane protein insertion efficiency factor YidD [Gemmataceae bacterium]